MPGDSDSDDMQIRMGFMGGNSDSDSDDPRSNNSSGDSDLELDVMRKSTSSLLSAGESDSESNNSDEQPEPHFFEGVEKLLEVWFTRSDGKVGPCDLRRIPR